MTPTEEFMKLFNTALAIIPGVQERIDAVNKNIESADLETKAIFNAALEQGCDIDGDVVIYEGKKYIVNILEGICKRIV